MTDDRKKDNNSKSNIIVSQKNLRKSQPSQGQGQISKTASRNKVLQRTGNSVTPIVDISSNQIPMIETVNDALSYQNLQQEGAFIPNVYISSSNAGVESRMSERPSGKFTVAKKKVVIKGKRKSMI